MTGCAGVSGSSDSASGSSSTTDLRIAVDAGSGSTRTWTLRCDPPGGTLPSARAACGRLTAAALRPLPPGTVCTQVYGGPQKARVRGSFRGRPVDVRFSRVNGCEIHRWDSARYLFPVKI